MTILSDNPTTDSAIADSIGREQLAPSRSRGGPLQRRVITKLSGAVFSVVGLASWLGWLSWRVADMSMNLIGFVVLVLEFVAFSAALVVTAGLWVGQPKHRRNRRIGDRARPLPILLAEALDMGEIVNETGPSLAVGNDDTGEIAWARRGIRVLGNQRQLAFNNQRIRDAAWSVVAVDGLRRLSSVLVLIIMLFSGAAPFATPPFVSVLMLLGGVGLLSVGHWLLSGGFVRPGSRLFWSMGSIGAGLGDGVSKSGLPIRWVVTMATVVALNISVALRGISDRWTHGLGPMNDDARLVSMSLAFVFVGAAGIALRRMPRPDLGFYGATHRLEEHSVRRLALGLTMIVAVIGFVAGVLPADAVTAAP